MFTWFSNAEVSWNLDFTWTYLKFELVSTLSAVSSLSENVQVCQQQFVKEF